MNEPHSYVLPNSLVVRAAVYGLEVDGIASQILISTGDETIDSVNSFRELEVWLNGYAAHLFRKGEVGHEIS